MIQTESFEKPPHLQQISVFLLVIGHAKVLTVDWDFRFTNEVDKKNMAQNQGLERVVKENFTKNKPMKVNTYKKK